MWFGDEGVWVVFVFDLKVVKIEWIWFGVGVFFCLDCSFDGGVIE